MLNDSRYDGVLALCDEYLVELDLNEVVEKHKENYVAVVVVAVVVVVVVVAAVVVV